jgi:hypothetical protein
VATTCKQNQDSLKVFGIFRKMFGNFWKFISYLYQEGLHFEDWIGFLLELLLLEERVVGMKCDDILGLSRPINTARGGLIDC